VFLDEERTVDNVQKHNICIKLSSPERKKTEKRKQKEREVETKAV
jgi:hypothetical protein